MQDFQQIIAGLSDAERQSLEWPMTETLMLEAAMCLWEAVIDGEGWERLPEAIKRHRQNVGTAQIRHDMMPFVAPLHIGWAVCDRDDNAPFDWDFTPWFLANCIALDETITNLILVDDWLDRCRNVHLNPMPAPQGGAA